MIPDSLLEKTGLLYEACIAHLCILITLHWLHFQEMGSLCPPVSSNAMCFAENGESPLMIQLKQHIQQKYFQTDLPVRDAAESAAEEGIVLGNSSKELPLAVCRLVANTVTSAKRHCLQEADQESDVFAATQDALKVCNPMSSFNYLSTLCQVLADD